MITPTTGAGTYGKIETTINVDLEQNNTYIWSFNYVSNQSREPITFMILNTGKRKRFYVHNLSDTGTAFSFDFTTKKLSISPVWTNIDNESCKRFC